MLIIVSGLAEKADISFGTGDLVARRFCEE